MGKLIQTKGVISTNLLLTALNSSLARMRVLSFIYLNSGRFGPEYKPMLGFNATELTYFTISSRLIFLDQIHQCTALQGTMCMRSDRLLEFLL